MYWRLLTSNPTAARDIVLSEKPVISTETDRMDKGMLDQLLLFTGTLGSIYHKNPNVSISYLLLVNSDLQTFIRTSKPKFLPDSPALNPSSRRHLVTPRGTSMSAISKPRAISTPSSSVNTSTPPVPARPTNTVPTPSNSNGDRIEYVNGNGHNATTTTMQVSDDPYGQLGDLDLMSPSGGAYQTDVPRPRRGQEEDLLF